MWLLASIPLIAMFATGVRSTGQFQVQRQVLQIVYVAALLWYLVREGPSIDKLPHIPPVFLKSWRLGRFIPLVGFGLVLLAALTDQGITRPLLMVAVAWVLVVWRRELRLRPIALGLALAVIAFLGGLPFWTEGVVGKPTFISFLVFTPLMFVAGGLLLKRTNLGASQLLAGSHLKASASFLWGCLLFVPMGLFNAAGGSQVGTTWVTQPWMPLSLPWFSGITEEVWFRFFLVGLCYFLVRPAFSKRPVLAVVFSVLFSAIVFGMGHGYPWMVRLLVTGLLYGLSMAAVFVRRDLEHTIGAHYMINMIPWLMAFLEVQ
jgi:hypothetical protein